MSAMTKNAVNPSHGACRLALPCASSSPSDAEPGGKPMPRKSSEVSAVIEPASDERQEGDGRHHCVGQNVTEHDPDIAQPERAGRADVVEVASAQKLRPHHAYEAHPAEQQHQNPSSHQKLGSTTLARMISR